MTDAVEESTNRTFTQLERRYDLDWLRVITIFIVFIYHCAKFFDNDPFSVKNNPADFVSGPLPLSTYKITANLNYLTAIGLPLFFIIAGMSTFYALGFMEKREIKTNKYILVRFIRLIIPFIIGLLTYVSLLVFLEYTNKGFISSTFFEFYPNYYQGIYGFDGNFSVFGHHLWFLFILFFLTVSTVHLFAYLRKEKFRSGFSKFASFFTKLGTIYLLIIPIYILETLHSRFYSDFPRLGGWDFLSYIFFLFYGFLFAYDKQFRTALKKNFIIAVVLGLLSLGTQITLNKFFLEEIWVNEVFSNIRFLFILARAIFSWSCLIIILDLGDRFLNKKSKIVKTLNEFVLPFYIIHFVIVSVVGFYIVRLDFLAISEYLLIFLISLAIIVPLLFIIRELNVLSFIFGMKVSKKKSIGRFFKKKKTNDVENVSEK